MWKRCAFEKCGLKCLFCLATSRSALVVFFDFLNRARARHRTRRLGRESSRRRFSLSTRATLLFSSRVVISMRKARRAFHPLGSVFSSSFSKIFERSLFSRGWRPTQQQQQQQQLNNKQREKKKIFRESIDNICCVQSSNSRYILFFYLGQRRRNHVADDAFETRRGEGREGAFARAKEATARRTRARSKRTKCQSRKGREQELKV